MRRREFITLIGGAAACPDVSATFELADKEQVNAVLVEADTLTVRYSGTITDECLVRNLPAMHTWPFEVPLGALIAYGPAEPVRTLKAPQTTSIAS